MGSQTLTSTTIIVIVDRQIQNFFETRSLFWMGSTQTDGYGVRITFIRSVLCKEQSAKRFCVLYIYLLYVFFWVFPRRPIVVCRRFGTLYQFHLQGLDVHTLHPALEDGTDRGFRNVGKPQSDAGEITKRIHTRFKTRRKFEIKNYLLYFKIS